jgi:hypothetical protein
MWQSESMPTRLRPTRTRQWAPYSTSSINLRYRANFWNSCGCAPRSSTAVPTAWTSTARTPSPSGYEKVGTVADVFAVPAFGHSSFDSDPAGEGRILKVERGGIMGIGATDLYIPVKDVQSVVPGEYWSHASSCPRK